MEVLAITKQPWLLTIMVMFMSMLLLALIFHHPYNPNASIDSTRTTLLNPQSDTQQDAELKQLLRRASKEDRAVILTLLDDHTWTSPETILHIFLESFRIGYDTKNLLNHLVVLTMGEQAYQTCISAHPHCFRLKSSAPRFASGSAKQLLVNPHHLTFTWRKNEALLDVLALGYNLLYTDVDVMWFRDPFQQLSSYNELAIARQKGRVEEIDEGFLYARASKRSIPFFQYWKVMRLLFPNSSDKSLLDAALEEIENMFVMKIEFLDTALFSSFCLPSEDMTKVCTVHANCCDNVEDKIHDLNLLLEDWRNYTELAKLHKNTTTGIRAPRRCRSR